MKLFLIRLVRLTAMRHRHRFLREIMLGLLVGIALGFVITSSVEWATVVILLYLVCVQTVALVRNQVFFSAGDLRILGFRDYNLNFWITYMCHYMARDLFVANLVAILISTGILFLTGQGWVVLMPLFSYLSILILIPGNVYLGKDLRENTRTAYVAAGLFMVFLAAALVAFELKISDEIRPVLPVIFLAGSITGSILLRPIASILHHSEARGEGVQWWRLLSWLPVHQVKDIRKEIGHALLLNLGGMAFFTILVIGASPKVMAPLALIAMVLENSFLGKKDGKYRLTNHDPLFSETKLPLDLRFLRRSKLLTAALDIPVKTVIVWGIMLVTGGFTWIHAITVVAVILMTNIIQAPMMFLDSKLARGLRYPVPMLVIILYLVLSEFGNTLIPLWACCIVAALVYLPAYWQVYRGCSLWKHDARSDLKVR